MEKIKEVNFAGSIIIFFALLFVYSKWGPAVPINVYSQQKGEPFMVTGTGKVSVVPDIASVTLGIQENGSDLASVQSSVNQKQNQLKKSLNDLGIKDKDIKTTSYSVRPQYDYESDITRIVGYSVSTSFRVRVEKLEDINKVLNLASSLGLENVGAVTFEVNEDTQKEKLQEAREEAVKEAKEKAEGLAKASGINLGRIINISEGGGGVRAVPMYDTANLSVDSTEPVVEPDIQPGETDISITVSLSYEVR